MTVVAFPANRMGKARLDMELSFAAYVVAAVRALGEPATVAEIESLLRATPAASHFNFAGQVVETLAELSLAGQGVPFDVQVFRPVELERQTAWAFTPDFRGRMRAAGYAPRLRSLT